MISCIIVDDEQHAIDVLLHYIGRIPTLEVVATFMDPIEALGFLHRRPVDLLFLDIQMPELSGIDLVKAIRGQSRVILTTAYSEFVSEGYELEVTDYLLKPVSFPRFLKAIQRLQPAGGGGGLEIGAPGGSEGGVAGTGGTGSGGSGGVAGGAGGPHDEVGLADDYFFVKTELKGKILKINTRDIDYIESMNNYVAIQHDGTKTIAYLNMKDLEERLPSRYFMRIHRSYIIALEKIVAIEGNTVHLRRIKEDIPLGETYKAAFLERMKGRIIQ